MDNWIKLITALASLAGFGGVVFAFLKFYLPWRESVKSKNNEKRIIAERFKIANIFKHLSYIKNNTPSDRVCVFKGHNCGGFPSAGKPYFATSLYYVDDIGSHVDFKLSDYQEIEVDEYYNRMILDTYQSGDHSVTYLVDDMPKSLLRSFYEAEKVIESMIIYLGVKGNLLYYMSVALHEGKLDEKDKTLIKLKAQAIRNNIL